MSELRTLNAHLREHLALTRAQYVEIKEQLDRLNNSSLPRRPIGFLAIPWSLQTIFIVLAVVFLIAVIAQASFGTAFDVAIAAGGPIWVVGAVLVRLGRRRRAREAPQD